MEKKGFIEEFKEFISKGNVLDMAMGVIIGGAFGKITSSLVNDVIMPIISILTGGIEFNGWKIVLKEAIVEADGTIIAAEVAINFGALVATVIDFLIIALTIFVIVKLVNRFKDKLIKEAADKEKEEEESEEEPSEEVKLLTEIRDALKK
ncbi:MAG: large-conductance mechanosensitive channel protein MscL [Bacillota bacterium]|jgi:large conductance mechanosensitive channel|nr:large-conductance mechanosensitive channel protein MscL [Bacillota bacterium]NLL25814.1 large-conductance mechanosensitive channel protein MscL [Erysipelotrichia bacterium]